jgi:hypothetical protein
MCRDHRRLGLKSGDATGQIVEALADYLFSLKKTSRPSMMMSNCTLSILIKPILTYGVMIL